MRILLYAGKGGVGKTSVAGATGAVTAEAGLKTLVMSLDPAHSLSDAFDLDVALMNKNRGQPILVAENLWIQELDIHEEIARNWGQVHRYVALLLNTSGIDDVLAEELAVLPGMEEVSALLHINRYRRDGEYDLVILDCAPTAESLRFVSLPKTLDWYMSKIFNIERRIARYVRPVAQRLTDVPLPDDDYFAGIESLYKRLHGVDQLLIDPATTSVRLVTNPEKMVLRETQRAFMFFCLHQLAVDMIIINRVLESGAGELKTWRQSQQEYLALAESYFQPVPILRAPFHQAEMLGHEKLLRFGRELYQGQDPTAVFYRRRNYAFERRNGRHRLRLHVPFVTREEIELTKVGDELIVRVGNFKKNVALPRTFALLTPQKARLEGDNLVVEFESVEDHPQTPSGGQNE